MNKFFTKIATATLGVAMAIGVGVAVSHSGVAKETKADDTLVFNFATTGSNADDGTSFDTSGSLTNVFSSGSNYIAPVSANQNFVTATRVYYGGKTGKGLKIGTSSNNGTLKFNLASQYQVTPTKITINACAYSSKSGKEVTFQVNGTSYSSTISSTTLADLDFDITSKITYLELKADKYAWINSITIHYSTSTDPTVSVSNFEGTYLDNYILPGQTGTLTKVWTGEEPEYQDSDVTWTVTPSNAFSALNANTGAFTANSSITEKTQITIGLSITTGGKTYTAQNKTMYICPHALSSDSLSRSSIKNTFTIDDELVITKTSNSGYLKATFMDVGEVDILDSTNYPDYYGGVLSATLAGEPIELGTKLTKAENGKSLKIFYTYGGNQASASAFNITVNDKEIPEGRTTASWDLVKDIDDLSDGDTIALVVHGSTATRAISDTQNVNNRAYTTVTKNNDGSQITSIGSATQFTLGKITSGTYSGKYTFYGAATIGQEDTDNTVDSSGKGYLTAVSGSNYLRTSSTLDNANTAWTLSISSSGVASIKSQHSTARYIKYNTNNSSYWFATYQSNASNVSDMAIYKYNPATNSELLQHWVYEYMHFQDIAISDNTSGTACKSGDNAYYPAAKTALLALEVEHTGCITLLRQETGDFVDAKNRYEAWADACGDTTPYALGPNNELIVKAANNALTAKNIDITVLVIIISATTSIVLLGGLLFLKKRKEQ